VSDRYLALTSTGLGRAVVRNLGLPDPPRLERWTGLRAHGPLVEGVVVLGRTPGGRAADSVRRLLTGVGVAVADDLAAGERAKGLVLDATGISDVRGMTRLRTFFQPLLRRLLPCGRVVVVGLPPALAGPVDAQVAQRALEGFTRSLAKEMRAGATVQLVQVAPGAEEALGSTLAFLLSPRSAYVDGQVVRVGTVGPTGTPTEPDWRTPLAGRVVLVTGASRGIGADTARVLHRDGASVVGVDVPAAASELWALMDELDGEAVALDVTAVDAAQRLERHLQAGHGGVDVVVHNAGITRDRRLANMTRDEWDPVLGINLDAPVRITRYLLDSGTLREGGAVVGVASIAGIAGNNGQTNYGASKAGVIGLVEAFTPLAAERGVTVNAVAPGFIETRMTARLPLLVRQAGRRLNSLAQGGLPLDVAETVAWLASPGSADVSGNVVRVCGQSLLGA
jgi:3-oxoacyl-[acyl-carrier protein] reductase